MKNTEEILDFDFGFSAVSEDELEVVQVAQEQSGQLISNLQTAENKANLLYKAIIPLLNNLKANPEKEYIYWPDRAEKLEAFAEKLNEIINGDVS
jgi:hypothetical protein